jgi:uncharacterized membrane protein YdjX (TVP38/TMEM64 family)
MYWRFIGATFFIFLLMFAAAEAMGIHLLDSADQFGQWTLPVAAAVGVALLVADIVLPVPSSMIMVAHGSLFGFAGGAALSVVGSMGAALMGYWLGRQGKQWLNRWFRPEDFTVGDRFFAQWGIASVILSRPIPLISETVSVAAGAGNLGWKRMLLGAFLGTVPTALAYAWAGAYLGTEEAGIYAFLAVVGVAGVFVTLGLVMRKRKERAVGR